MAREFDEKHFREYLAAVRTSTSELAQAIFTLLGQGYDNVSISLNRDHAEQLMFVLQAFNYAINDAAAERFARENVAQDNAVQEKDQALRDGQRLQ